MRIMGIVVVAILPSMMLADCVPVAVDCVPVAVSHEAKKKVEKCPCGDGCPFGSACKKGKDCLCAPKTKEAEAEKPSPTVVAPVFYRTYRPTYYAPSYRSGGC
jgi:hypothetical protein